MLKDLIGVDCRHGFGGFRIGRLELAFMPLPRSPGLTPEPMSARPGSALKSAGPHTTRGNGPAFPRRFTIPHNSRFGILAPSSRAYLLPDHLAARVFGLVKSLKSRKASHKAQPEVKAGISCRFNGPSNASSPYGIRSRSRCLGKTAAGWRLEESPGVGSATATHRIQPITDGGGLESPCERLGGFIPHGQTLRTKPLSS